MRIVFTIVLSISLLFCGMIGVFAMVPGFDTEKLQEDDARRSEGQFCKNTVYFARDMPYSCFFSPYALLRISSIISSSCFSSGMLIKPTAVK